MFKQIFFILYLFLVSCTSEVNVDLYSLSREDWPVITLSAASESLSEGETSTISYTISKKVLNEVSFKVQTKDGTATSDAQNFVPVNQRVVIPAGTPAGSYALPNIQTLDNDIVCESTRNFRVEISELKNAVMGSISSAVINLEAQGLPTLSIADTSVSEGMTATITASLDRKCRNIVSFNPFTVGLEAKHGMDYEHFESLIQIPALTTSVTFNIVTLDDSLDELEETIILGIKNINNANYNKDHFARITINDNDVGGGAVKVAVNNGFSCALSAAGALKCWGRDRRGVLGQNGHHIGDDVLEMGDNLLPIDLGTGLTVKKGVRSLRSSCVIVDDIADIHDDKVKCWGNGGSGRLGSENEDILGDSIDELGDNLPFVNIGAIDTVTDIAATSGQVCVILTDGDVKCWGNGGAALGRADDIDENYGDEPGEMDLLTSLDFGPNLSAKSIYGGSGHFCVILDDVLNTYDNYVKCWGENSNGQLGIGTTTAMGLDSSSMGSNLPFVDLGSGRTAKLMSLGNNFSCVLLDNDKVKCWGMNGSSSYNRLGYLTDEQRGDEPGEMGDNLPYIDFGPNYVVKDISSGYNSSCAVVSTDNVTDAVKCWGWSGYSQRDTSNNPGAGSSWDIVDFGVDDRAIAVNSGLSQNCAILINNEVKCWGKGRFGISGIGASYSSNPSVDDSVDLGTGAMATAFFKGGGSGDAGGVLSPANCVLLSDGSVKCWGQNMSGRLLNPKNMGDQAMEMGSNLPESFLGAGRTAKDISAGDRHVCALLDNNKAKCWGRNGSKLGQGQRGILVGYGDGRLMDE